MIWLFETNRGYKDCSDDVIARNPDLVQIRGNNGQLPLLTAIIFGHMETVSFLFERTNFNLLNNGMLEKHML